MGKSIAEVILRLRDEFCAANGCCSPGGHQSFADINAGCCEAFASAVVDAIPGAEARWDGDMPGTQDGSYYYSSGGPTRWPTGVAVSDGVNALGKRNFLGHCFVIFDGRFYDSEAPEGVPDWRELPCEARYLASDSYTSYLF